MSLPPLSRSPLGLEQRIEALQRFLAQIAVTHPDAAFASSLAAEDMVLTDMILRLKLPIRIFTLDTGRLPPETLVMLDRISEYYGQAVDVFRPDPQHVVSWVEQHGADAFYDSVALRKDCCRLRKIEPLQRALQGHSAWLTGQRRSQSVTRADLPLSEHDAAHEIAKFNPLADWSHTEVWAYIERFGVPYNALHDQGYPSIGCAPCTRPVAPGEDIRAGRWWWETPDSRECGLHVVDGKLVRSKT